MYTLKAKTNANKENEYENIPLVGIITATGENTNTIGGFLGLWLIDSDNVASAGQGFVNGFAIEHQAGGAEMSGGRQGLQVNLVLQEPSSPNNPNSNYVGATFQSISEQGDGGTTGDEKGAFFGANMVGWLRSVARWVLHVTGAEFDVIMETGSQAKHKAGVTISSHMNDKEHGDVTDAGVWVTSQFGGVGFRDGIDFSTMGGASPIADGGTIIRTHMPDTSIQTGIDLSGVSVIGNLIQSALAGLSNNYLWLGGKQVLCPRQAAIPDPSEDISSMRAAIVSVLEVLRNQGAIEKKSQ